MFLAVFRVLHEHIQRLSKVVTANHRALQIPEVIDSHSVGGVINQELLSGPSACYQFFEETEDNKL